MYRYTVVILLVLIAAACSGPSKKKRAEPLEIFSTQILLDGTKLFAFTLERPQRRQNSEGGRQGKRGKGGHGGQGGRRGGEKERGNDMEKQIETRLLAMLEQTGYCREGYVELDRNLLFGNASIRGECKEGATPEDRKNFING
jgi:hypothetical protein